MKRREDLIEENKSYLESIDRQLNDLKDNSQHILKIAALAGAGSLIAWWIYKLVANEDEDEGTEPKPKKKKRKRKAKKEVSNFNQSVLADELKEQASVEILKLASIQLKQLLDELDENEEK